MCVRTVTEDRRQLGYVLVPVVNKVDKTIKASASVTAMQHNNTMGIRHKMQHAQPNCEVLLTMLRRFGSRKAIQLALGVVVEWIVALIQITALPQ